MVIFPLLINVTT